MNDSDVLVVKQLLEHCDTIQKRIAEFEIDVDKFTGNSAFFDMLLMPLFQIGELAGALSPEYVAAHSEIPWHAIRGFRNIIAHDYGVVEPLWAWNTIQCDIPTLREFLERELS